MTNGSILSPRGAAPGKFITLEGIDGAGKSSHVAFICEQVRALRADPVVTREPGGTPLGELSSTSRAMSGSACASASSTAAASAAVNRWALLSKFP